MNENYRSLLEAAFPSIVVRAWQMLPTSEKLSHFSLAGLIILNNTLTMENRIKYLELLRDECHDIYDDSDLIPLIDNEINDAMVLYHEFIKSEPRIIYSTNIADSYSSSINTIIQIAQENNFDRTPFKIRRNYIDAKEYESIIEGSYDETGRLLRLKEIPYFYKYAKNNYTRLHSWRHQLIINHFFNPGDSVFNIHTKETGIIKKNFKTDLEVIINNTEKSENTDLWFIPYIEYDIGE